MIKVDSSKYDYMLTVNDYILTVEKWMKESGALTRGATLLGYNTNMSDNGNTVGITYYFHDEVDAIAFKLKFL